MNIGQAIGVAGGEAKAAAIPGALRGGHIHILVTPPPQQPEKSWPWISPYESRITS